MATVLNALSHSLKEFRVLPGFTPADAAAPHVSLETPLCSKGDGSLMLHTPFLSAAMQSVTGTEMAIALAQLGAIGILPVSQPVEEQCASINSVKRFKGGFQTNILTVSPEQTIGSVVDTINQTGYTTFPVTTTGEFHSRLVGILTDKDFDVRRDHDRLVSERMKTDMQVGVDIEGLGEANDLMIRYGRGFLPIVSPDGVLQSAVFKKDLDKHLKHPNESVDDLKRLLVGAAISTHPEDRQRVVALAETEADVLVLDASDGHTAYQREMIEYVRAHTRIPVIGGNVVTAKGFHFLAEAGVNAVKVGMGIGSGCTTQQVKATGRGQATALMETAAARDEWAQRTGKYIPLIADGGISGPADMSVALALGADALMMGNFFARYTESAGNLVRNAAGEIVKEYWMEGSTRAFNTRRYTQIKDTFFEEGISGFVPHVGSIYDKLPTVIQMLKATLATAGCRDLSDLHANVVLEMQSTNALLDSQVHDMVPMNVDLQVL
jgi:IMP dehydrogenase